MKTLIQGFPAQLEESLNIASSYNFKHPPTSHSSIIIAGLGGSGIGAEIVQNYIHRDLSTPLVICKDYALPGFVKESTLVIVCSYSGNTEETLTAMESAIASGANLVAVCSGGQIADLAAKNNLDCILIPSGMPPRACLGYSMVQLLRILDYHGYIGEKYITELRKTVDFLNQHAERLKLAGKALAEKLVDKLPIIYADQHISGIATRWRQQINENGKMLGWERILPEMNHNELVGWRDKNNNLAVLFLHSGLESSRIKQRIELNKVVIQSYTNSIYDVFAEGDSYFERAFYLILLGDWLSWYLAQLRNQDATEVKVIDFLKSSLAKQG